jgi:hypothetical protein
MKVFDCDPKWPICLYDFTYQYRLSDFIILKTSIKLSDYIHEDYFTFDHDPKHMKKKKENFCENFSRQRDLILQKR